MDLTTVSGIENAERVRYLRLIDDLRELGIDESVPLPELVVAGDQSSGKSSVLEGLTNIPFPIAGELCTRFATRLVLKNCPVDERIATATISPGTASIFDEVRVKRLKEFFRTLKGDEITPEAIEKIFLDVAAEMGLPRVGSVEPSPLFGGSANTGFGSAFGTMRSPKNFTNALPAASLGPVTRRFTDDILEIEIQERGGTDLTMVDVPGLFHNPTVNQTEDDKRVVRNLITGYLKNPRTIILCVMNATQNLASQEVFDMAHEADPERQRTVGIITKCDLIQQGDERSVLRVALNGDTKLKHGWFTVRNRSPAEIADGVTIEKRHENETALFCKPAWEALDRQGRAGVKPLLKFLGRLQHQQIKKELPGMVAEISSQAATVRQALEDLGGSRQTPLEQRQYLMSIASKYEHHAERSLVGRYDCDLDPDHIFRLRTHLVDARDDFASNMKKYGHCYVFKTFTNHLDSKYDKSVDDNCPEMVLKAREEGDIYVWIQRNYKASRGVELPGMVNPLIVEELFHAQTLSWEYFSNRYFDQVCETLEVFNNAAFELFVREDGVRQKLQAHLAAIAEDSTLKAKDEHTAILKDERGMLQTSNSWFEGKLVSARRDRLQARLEGVCAANGGQRTLELQLALDACSLGAEEAAIYDIHDMLKTYYEVALRRFQDNMIIPVVERNLLGSEGLVKTLTVEFVGRLSDEELAEIAGETQETTQLRESLLEKRDGFKRAQEKARKI